MKKIFKINNSVFFLLGASIPFLNTWKLAGHSIGNFAQITVLLLAFYLFVVPKTALKSNPYKKSKSYITIYLLAFTLLVCVSLLLERKITSLSFSQVFNVVDLFIIYSILSEIAFYDEAVEAIIKGLLTGFLLAVLIGFMQYFNVAAFSLFAEKDLNNNTAYVSNENMINVSRVWGPFGNSLTFSLYLSVAGIMLFYYFRLVKNKSLWAWAIFLLSLVAISFTISRMAIIAFLASFLIIEFFITNKYKKIAYAAGILILLFSYGFIINKLANSNPLISRFLNSQDDFKEGRLNLWVTGYKVWLENLFFGAGPGNLGLELYKHGWNEILDETTITTAIGHVENYYLTILYTFGLIPFIFFVAFIIKYFQVAIALFWYSVKTRVASLSMIVLPGLICFAINNLVNPVLNSDERIQMLFILMLVIINSYYKKLKTLNA